jgi:alginate O-acetyltransferase complex protein AlgJ
MSRFLFKLFLFLTPLMAAVCVELFVLPIDFFTFRVWEAVVVKKYRNLLPGVFYPNMEITKIEDRDLSHHTPFSEKEEVTWILDRFGYRKKETGRRRHDVVIVGDSNIVGTGLTQEEIFSEVLEEALGMSVYPLSPASMNTFLRDRRFLQDPPKIVILESIEREITDLPTLRKQSPSRSKVQVRIEEIGFRLRDGVKESRWVQSLTVLLDRLCKMNMLHYVRASLRRMAPPFRSSHITAPTKDGPVFFLQGARANQPVPRDQLEGAVRTIKAYRDLLASKGIRFIFLPVPNKETIYYEALGTGRPVFLSQLVAALETQGIETVDIQKAFEGAFRNDSVLLYRAGDTHWNEKGVRLAADFIRKLIEKGG